MARLRSYRSLVALSATSSGVRPVYTHTHTHVYIYICMRMCVDMCVRACD